MSIVGNGGVIHRYMKMADEAVQRRKSQLFLQNISPVTDTYDELVKNKLQGGKFPTTLTGIVQMLGMLILLFSASFFLAQPVCEGTPRWYAFLFPLSAIATLLLQIVFYLVFSLGCTITRPGFWIYLDIGVMLLFSVETIISSVITYTECSNHNVAYEIPGIFGMAGGLVLIVSCGSLFMLYRYVEDMPAPSVPTPHTSLARKSVFA